MANLCMHIINSLKKYAHNYISTIKPPFGMKIFSELILVQGQIKLFWEAVFQEQNLRETVSYKEEMYM